MEEKKKKMKISFGTAVMLAIIFILVVVIIGMFYYYNTKGNNKENIPTNNSTQNSISVENAVADNNKTNNENEAKSGKISNFDLSFLKLENKKENKIYSPLSIKYALKMLEEGASGETKTQISKIIGKYNLTKYTSNKNMSLANAIFIKDTFKDGIKENYTDILKNKYDAEVKFDSFADVKNINSWISNKTLKLINNMLDKIDPDQRFILVNALGIDMEWKEKFLTEYGFDDNYSYSHEKVDITKPGRLSANKFDNNTQTVSGMKIEATINNYDILKELGKENIKKTVSDEYKKWLTEEWNIQSQLNGDTSAENIEKKTNKYLTEKYPEYISELDENYHKVFNPSDFSIYVDNNVKVFAKDLKEYNGTTLQYIGIMPTSENLDSYIKNTDEEKINTIIGSLKELKYENFKEGVVTKITGYIPKFKFEYDLNLKNDLKSLGITNIFEQGKCDLTNMTDDKSIYVNTALHKANIEFTQDGIKAAAATILGGLGAGGDFDYLFDVPVETIDLTFDKPYMFLIRDKKTGENWFTGTVYEPLSWDDEEQKD